MIGLKLTNGNGWHQLRWTLVGALILAMFGGVVAGWRQFTLMEERMTYLLRLNEQQNALFETIKDGMHSLQQQLALNGQVDDAQRERLMEHDTYLRHILERLRALERTKEDSH